MTSQTPEATASQTSPAKSQANTALVGEKSRKTLKAEGRKKRSLKLKTDLEFSKKFFAAKSKKSVDKKAAFRKKKTKKK